MLFADCPLPTACGRGRTGDGKKGVFRNEAIDACWFSFDGDVGLCGGDKAPGLAVANRGDAMREVDDTTELGLGGGKWADGEADRSGVPFAWKNLGCGRSSPTTDPTTDPLEL